MKGAYPEKFQQAVEERERQERLDAWAGMAMQGLLAASSPNEPLLAPAERAVRAFEYAESLEAERARRLK